MRAPRPTLLALAVASTLACGKRGDPIPPLRKTPLPVTALRLAQRGDSLDITFVAPRATTEGARLGVLEIELLQAEGPGDFGKLARKTRVKAAPGESLTQSAPLPSVGTVVRVAARAISKGHESVLTVITSLTVQKTPERPRKLEAHASAHGIALEWKPPVHMPTPPPPPPPTPVPSPIPGAPSPSPSSPVPSPALGGGASPTPSAVPTSPSPSPTASPSPSPSPLPTANPSPSPTPSLADLGPAAAESPSPVPEVSPAPEASPAPSPGTSPSPSPRPSPTPPPITTGFWVYRRAKEGSYGRPLQTTPPQTAPLQTTSIEDTEAAPGDTWCYVVRTVASTEPVVESEPTTEVCVTAADVAPPAAPTGVAVIVRGGVAEVSWSPSPEADLVIYRVYRARRGGSPERLAEVPAGETTYRDSTLAPGALYFYTVTAVDKAGNESPPSSPGSGSLP